MNTLLIFLVFVIKSWHLWAMMGMVLFLFFLLIFRYVYPKLSANAESESTAPTNTDIPTTGEEIDSEKVDAITNDEDWDEDEVDLLEDLEEFFDYPQLSYKVCVPDFSLYESREYPELRCRMKFSKKEPDFLIISTSLPHLWYTDDIDRLKKSVLQVAEVKVLDTHRVQIVKSAAAIWGTDGVERSILNFTFEGLYKWYGWKHQPQTINVQTPEGGNIIRILFPGLDEEKMEEVVNCLLALSVIGYASTDEKYTPFCPVAWGEENVIIDKHSTVEWDYVLDKIKFYLTEDFFHNPTFTGYGFESEEKTEEPHVDNHG